MTVRFVIKHWKGTEYRRLSLLQISISTASSRGRSVISLIPVKVANFLCIKMTRNSYETHLRSVTAVRFSNTTGQKRIEPLKRVFILQASLEMEIACVILFFCVERNVYSDFRLKRNKAFTSQSAFFIKWPWFKHFLLCWLKEQITHYKNFFEKKKRFYQNESFLEFFWCLTFFGTLNSADHEIDRLICDVMTKEFKKWKLELFVYASLSWGRQCWQCCCNFDASY